jgi:hypothetical protein
MNGSERERMVSGLCIAAPSVTYLNKDGTLLSSQSMALRHRGEQEQRDHCDGTKLEHDANDAEIVSFFFKRGQEVIPFTFALAVFHERDFQTMTISATDH